MSYADDLDLIDCIRHALGKAPLPEEPPDTGVAVTLDGVRRMTPAEWMEALDCSKQAVSQRLQAIRERIERGDPNPYRYNPVLGNGARKRLRKRRRAPVRIYP